MAAFRQCATAVRQFSSSSLKQAQAVQAPIKLFGVEGRYAHALFSAASKENKIDAVEKETKTLQDLVKNDPAFADFLRNPSLQRKEKMSVITEIMSKQKFSNLTSNLLVTMAENGRLNKTADILNAYGKIMRAYRGEVSCTVTTAKPLDASSQKELETTLNGFLKKGETLMLDMKVDPALIGGMTVTIGDRYVDMSMASKIKTYTDLIKTAV